MYELYLPLKTEWFNLTKSGMKTEDYREISGYWCHRLLEIGRHRFLDLGGELESAVWQELIEDLANLNRKHKNVDECLAYFGVKLKKFDCNVMTLGYPKSSDTERILRLEHKGIEIRTGNYEWGAEPNKLYFVIKHGQILS